ncbi:hypothetical protein [Streptomyces sp. IB2014 016-6]|uniref:hypothetical protein n=1 Tax=Streptomyces sp. IB2014 016-6 TaxID=2517818 RepID=UPI0011CCDB18|nr:hypothetical protein [Streptomyces sp. IB2014 016-6]TXL84730.1 hypothetical protein EW053_33430 [Streptomyces sp. IB2014 016-6]
MAEGGHAHRAGDGYVPSILFAEQQNVELAREAWALSQAFTDVEFCRAVAGGVLPPSRRKHFFAQGDRRLRLHLDGLLLAFRFSPQADGAMREEPEVMRLAGRVEAFLVPSAAAECQAIEYDSAGADSSYVMAISPLVVDIMAQLMWAVPLIAVHYGDVLRRPREEIFRELIVAPPGGRTPEQVQYLRERRALNELDESIASYLRLRESGGTSIPFRIIPEGEDDSTARVESRDTYAACSTFLLAHELAHITGGHFFKPLSPVGEGSFLAGLSEEQRREVEADCSAFTLTLNALIMSEPDARGRPRIPDFDRLWKSRPHGRTKLLPKARRQQREARDDAQYLVRRVLSATQAALCFYAVMDVLSATARRHGRQAEAERLGRVAERGELMRGWLKWMLTELEELWTIRLNIPLATQEWESLDRHVDYIKRTIVDAWPNHEPPKLPWARPEPQLPRWIKLKQPQERPGPPAPPNPAGPADAPA